MKPTKTWIDDKTDHATAVSHHPAFGMVSVSRTHTGSTTLFASDLSHQEVVTLRFFEGEMQEQDGIQKPRCKRETSALSVQFSLAQWATMITSFGMGEGVPCTLLAVRDGKLQRLPDIDPVETVKERFDRQIKEAAAREVEKLHVAVDALGALMAKGKASKTELTALYKTLSSVTGNMPENLAFTNELIQEQMTGIVAAGKSELEGYAIGVASRLGIKEISRLAAIENKADKE